ncbi:Major Facilitator Superfamily protein [Coccidioides posadasii C735 delta SOWgp]|uniref:GliA n=2 Tax=Coccidioides posadasii TaxID=199306 RepID=A0A0J6FLX6_COCPO|nr:Major Facilitator Superfamily protein [Coccidioides posadasii C735 delta SOWgp]EER29954.1 Major Facilitator Superfamily protein [Coccidioides posadasii C735 delta SOWgp]KMM71383.1 GliA [Coccidioides posadasii RMSCC 3488]|eukprot:XP_003072099.1 Major Facilitator Superfamily protein [Coccidioides posadasii C735 delta SOWgp]
MEVLSENKADVLPDGDTAAPVRDNDNDNDNDSVKYPSAFWASCVSVGVALALFLVGLDMTIVAAAIPRITDDFKGINLVGWYASAYFIALACFQPFWGKVYPFFSIKYTFLLAVFIFDLGSLVAGVAPSSTVLIVGRAIMGVGGAGIASGGYAILGVVVRPKLRPVFTGFITTIYSIANVLGPVVGGIFTQQTTWRWCFYINLPIGGASALVIFLLFRPPQSTHLSKAPLKEKLSHMDPIGITFALASLIFFTRALEVAGIDEAWNSAEVVGFLVACAVSTVAFVVSQYLQGDHALLVSRLLKKRIVAMGMAFGFFHEGAFYLLLYYVPIYFQVVVGVSPSRAGVYNLPLLISCGVGSALAGVLVSLFGHYVPLMLWASAGGCIGSGLIYTLHAASPQAQWVGYQFLAGLAYGSGLPLAIIAGQANARAEDLASTTAMLLFSFCVGSSTSLGAGQSVLSNLLLSKLPSLAPNVDPLSVIVTGATEIRSAFPADVVPGIVEAYLYCLRAVFLIVTAYAGVAVFFAVANKWERLKLKG